MNSISFFFIIAFGLLFGYVFNELLHALGIKKEQAYSFLATIGLGFLGLIGYFTMPIFLTGQFAFSPLGSLYGSVYFWMVLALIIGSAVRVVQYMFLGRATSE